MITIAPTPAHDLPQDLQALFKRLGRINAQRTAMRIAADDGVTPLDPMLDTLERDLTLAARAAAGLHDRMAAAGGR